MSTSVTRLRTDLIALVDQVQAATGLSDVMISRLATEQNHRMVRSLRAGDNQTLNSLARLETWLRGALDIIAGDPAAYAAWLAEARGFVKLRGVKNPKPKPDPVPAPRQKARRTRPAGKKRTG